MVHSHVEKAQAVRRTRAPRFRPLMIITICVKSLCKMGLLIKKAAFFRPQTGEGLKELNELHNVFLGAIKDMVKKRVNETNDERKDTTGTQPDQNERLLRISARTKARRQKRQTVQIAPEKLAKNFQQLRSSSSTPRHEHDQSVPEEPTATPAIPEPPTPPPPPPCDRVQG